jgi:hypothetical protein
VYAPMCMYCPVCRAPIHPSPVDTPHQTISQQALRHGVGWLVRARSITTAARAGDTHMHERAAWKERSRLSHSLTRCDGLGVRPATRPLV